MSYRPGILPRDLPGLVNQLEFELATLAKLVGTSGTNTVRVFSSISSGAAPVNNFQAKTTAITTGGTAIALSPSIPNYIILYRCYNSSGDGVGVDFTLKTSGGFTATPLENSTLEWAALPT